MPLDDTNHDHGGGPAKGFITTVFKPGIIKNPGNTVTTEICCTGHAVELLASALLTGMVSGLQESTGEEVLISLQHIESIYVGGEVGKKVDAILKDFNRVFANKRN